MFKKKNNQEFITTNEFWNMLSESQSLKELARNILLAEIEENLVQTVIDRAMHINMQAQRIKTAAWRLFNELNEINGVFNDYENDYTFKANIPTKSILKVKIREVSE